MYGRVLKITQLSAHAQNHVSIEHCRKLFTTIVRGDLDIREKYFTVSSVTDLFKSTDIL